MYSQYEVKKGINSFKGEIKECGAGHSIPTGQPMRNMILLVEAVDSRGDALNILGRIKYLFGSKRRSQGGIMKASW